MSLKSVVRNYKEHGLKYFTIERARLFLRSLVRKLTGYRIKESDAIVFSQIVTYKSLTCPDCVKLGHCKVCKCPIDELFTAMDVGCSDGKFPEFEQKRNWKIIWKELRRFNIRSAFKHYKDVKHWREGWKEYIERNKVFFTKFYG